MSRTAIVTGLSPGTQAKSIEDFFSFCGHISKVDVSDGKAVVTFATPGGVTNAVLLNGSHFEDNVISVTRGEADAQTDPPATSEAQADPTGSPAGATKQQQGEEVKPPVQVHQEDKPKTAIVCELLAHGYLLGDEVTKRALDFDKKHGYSGKFASFLADLDKNWGQKFPGPDELHPAGAAAAGQAKEGDKEKVVRESQREAGGLESGAAPPSASAPAEGGEAPTPPPTANDPSFVANVQASVQRKLEDPHSLLSKAHTVWHGPHVAYAWAKVGNFYNTAANHPKIQKFYSSSSQTIQDVHNQAKEISQQKRAAASASNPDTAA